MINIEVFKNDVQKCVDHVSDDLAQIRTGRATPELVEGVIINAYEMEAPIKNYANITVSDSKTLIIQPWDKSILDNISKGIMNANMGFSPITEGDRVIVKIPDLTEERRKEYVKIMRDRIEDGRVAVRQVRQKYMRDLDDAQKNGVSEDEVDRDKQEIEKIVKDANEQIEELKENKEKDLMTI